MSSRWYSREADAFFVAHGIVVNQICAMKIHAKTSREDLDSYPALLGDNVVVSTAVVLRSGDDDGQDRRHHSKSSHSLCVILVYTISGILC